MAKKRPKVVYANREYNSMQRAMQRATNIIKKVVNKIVDGTEEEYEAVADMILDISIFYAPEDTGTLIDSAYKDNEGMKNGQEYNLRALAGKDFNIVVGFDKYGVIGSTNPKRKTNIDSYAVPVHEIYFGPNETYKNPNKEHKSTSKPLFLQKAFKEVTGDKGEEFKRAIEQKIKEMIKRSTP